MKIIWGIHIDDNFTNWLWFFQIFIHCADLLMFSCSNHQSDKHATLSLCLTTNTNSEVFIYWWVNLNLCLFSWEWKGIVMNGSQILKQWWQGHNQQCSIWNCDDLVNTLRPRQNGRQFTDDILQCIFLNENVWIPIEISLKFIPKGPIDNILALVQIMTWRRQGNKPLSEPMMVRLLKHICVTRPQWVNWWMCAS